MRPFVRVADLVWVNPETVSVVQWNSRRSCPEIRLVTGGTVWAEHFGTAADETVDDPTRLMRAVVAELEGHH